MCAPYHRIALFALVTYAAWGPVVPAAAQSATPSGYTYMTRFEQFDVDPSGRQTSTGAGLARTSVLGDSARVEIEAGNEALSAGRYAVTTDGGRTVALVLPAQRQYTVIGMDALLQLVGATVRESGFELEQTHVAPDETIQGDTLLGFAVEHHRVARSLRRKSKAPSTSLDEITETHEWWTSSDTPKLPDPLGAVFRTVFAAVIPVDSATAAQFVHQVGPAAGLSLRSRHRFVKATAQQQASMEMRLEVTKFGPASVRHELFTIPAEYERKDPSELLERWFE